MASQKTSKQSCSENLENSLKSIKKISFRDSPGLYRNYGCKNERGYKYFSEKFQEFKVSIYLDIEQKVNL